MHGIPLAIILGCYFHFCRNSWKHMQKKDLAKAYLLFHIYSRQETNMFGPESPHMSNSVVYLK